MGRVYQVKTQGVSRAPYRAIQVCRIMNKFGAKKTEVDGIVFDSKKEAGRYVELKLLERAGEIRNLELQPSFECVVNDQKICKYNADFAYFEGDKRIVEDVKGYRGGAAFKVYRLKVKLVKALFNVEVVEI